MTAVDTSRLLGQESDLGLERVFRAARSDRASRYYWETLYVGALLVVDFTVALACAALAFAVRFGTDWTPTHSHYLLFASVLPVLWIATLALNRAYEPRYLFVGADEYQRVIRGALAAMATVAIISYSAHFEIARGYVLVALPVATVGTLSTRFILRKALHHAHERGHYLRRVLVVGYANAVQDLCHQLRRERYHGLEVVGACLPEPVSERSGGRLIVRTRVDVPVFGGFDDVAHAVASAAADTVIVLSCPQFDGPALRRLAWQLERGDVNLIVASGLLDIGVDRTSIRVVDGLPMLLVDHARLRGARRLVKRAFDIVLSAIGLLFLAPFLMALAVIIRLDSPGPALFRQTRVGRNGREFRIFKLRTMGVAAEERLSDLMKFNESDGALFKMRNDPRVTRVGAFLRRYSIDELPQLINVLRGDMSLVGPRPPLPSEVAIYPRDMLRRLVVRPGVTGLWQVSGRADLPWDEVVRLDLRYVESWSLTLDMVLLLRTITAVLRSSGAY